MTDDKTIKTNDYLICKDCLDEYKTSHTYVKRSDEVYYESPSANYLVILTKSQIDNLKLFEIKHITPNKC